MKRTKRAKAKGIRNTPKRIAERFGTMTRVAIVYGKWFGPKGLTLAPELIPGEHIKAMAQRAAHWAIAHRNRYPLGAPKRLVRAS